MASVRSVSWSALFFATAFAIAGCSSDTTTSGESTGSLDLSLQLAPDVVINEVKWVISGPLMEDMMGTIDTSAPGATASVEVFGLPPGDGYTVTLIADVEDQEEPCIGSADFSVTKGVSVPVMVMLNCKRPERLGGVRVNGKFNVCAELAKVIVSPLQTSVGNQIDLSALGVDVDDDAEDIQYLWSASTGIIADPTMRETSYTCTEVIDEETITILISDDWDFCMDDWDVKVKCVEGECEIDDDCAELEICSEQFVCIPDGGCNDDDDCAELEICNDDNECEAVECKVEDDCGELELCIANSCFAVECKVEGDCGVLEICTENNECEAVECKVEDDCGELEICSEQYVCIPGSGCNDDDDCGGLEICNDDNECEAVECKVDDDCVELNQCKMGACDAGVCGLADVEDGTSCELPDIDAAECRMGECEPVNVTLGDDFALVFQQNGAPPTLHLFLSGPVATSGEVSIGATFSEPFTVTPGEVTTVDLPSGSEITTNDVIEVNAAVRITSEAPITVYGLNRRQASTDAFAGLPTPSLGLRHRVMSWPAAPFGTSQLAIAAVAGPGNDPNALTSVTITPSATAGSRPAGVPYTIEMKPFDAYQLQSSGDLTGTLIESSRPIAVFGGNKCANIPNVNVTFCDHIVEQMPRVSTWGREALTVPLATRIGGDTFRIMADQDGTAVELEGAAPESFMLNAGEFAERLLDGSYRISSDAPILVAQYSNSTSFDGVTSDPFMMLIPSSEQFLDSYTFATPASGFPANYANIVALTTDAMAGDVLLDGVPIAAAEFSVLTGTEFSATQAVISLGTHTVSAPNPAGLYVYGFATADSYGYPGGFSAGAQ